MIHFKKITAIGHFGVIDDYTIMMMANEVAEATEVNEAAEVFLSLKNN